MNHYNIDRLRESMVKILGSHGQPVAGSGFIIRSDGYLVTCHHVIYVLDALNVEYQGQIYAAEWCEELSNLEVDIAILKIDIKDAKAVSIINPQHLSTSVTVYGFPPSQKKYFPEGIAVSAQSIRRSAPLNTVSTYRTREIKATNPWNKLPQDESTFLSHRIDAKVDAGTSGGAVFAEELGGVVGVIQCSKSDESYVIRWDNITEYLDKLELEPEKNAVCQFLEKIENNFKYDKLLHIPEQPIILKDQYIPIQVTLERKYTHAVETTWGYAESEAELKQAYALKRLEESQPSQVDWKEAKKRHQRIIVLADPGMGKSTLLRREACLTAQEERQSLKNNTIKLEEVVFPLFLRLSDLAETPEEIIDAIPVLIQRDYSEIATKVIELLREKLKIGKCLLLLDALDEVSTEHRQRQRLFEKLNRFAQRKSPCPIICTSRIVGYGGAFVAGVKEVEIVPFNQKQTEEYIETWFRNAAGYLNDDTVSASSLIRELRNKPQIRGLAQNPLLLSLICSLYQEKGLTLPAQRCQVYEQAVRYMLGKWSKNRNPELNDAWIDAKTELLEELAYQFSCDGKEIFTLRELRHKIDKYLRSENASSDFRDKNASCLIKELSEQDGILQKLHKDSDGQYLFLHRTFQEYLTACYLKQASDSMVLAREHFWEYEWHETLSLLAGLMENPVPLLQSITDEKDDIFSTLLLLAGRCIAESQENSHPLISEIIDKIYTLWWSNPFASFIQSTFIFLNQAKFEVLDKLQKELNNETWYIRGLVTQALGEIRSLQTVEALVQVLEDPNSNVRRLAVEALGQIGSSESVTSLKRILNDQNTDIATSVVRALAQIRNSDAIAGLIQALDHLDERVRIQAAFGLGRIGKSEAISRLIEAFKDANGYVRSIAEWALVQIGSPEVIEALIEIITDEDIDSRWQAVGALGKIGNPKAIKPLIDILIDEEYDVIRWEAVEALEKIGNQEAIEALTYALDDPNRDVRLRTQWALGQRDSLDITQLIQAFEHPNLRIIRWWAGQALAEIGSPKAVASLIQALEHPDSELRIFAASALGKTGKAEVVPALVRAFNAEDSDIRTHVIGALQNIGSPEALAVIIHALNHLDSSIRSFAASILGEIGNLEAVPELIQALKDDCSNVRVSVIEALGKIANPKAIDPLIQRLNDKESDVKKKAAEALEKIGTSEILAKLLQRPEINLRDPDIFLLTRTLAVRFSKERLPFIPVYPELVAHKQ